MKVRNYCFSCLRNLVTDTVRLSGASEDLLATCYALIEERFCPDACPPDIANEMLRLVRSRTGVYDPYADKKAQEFLLALEAAPEMARSFTPSLEGVFKCSVMGNSVDVFVEAEYDMEKFCFSGDIVEIDNEIECSGGKALILGDNTGEFLFDLPLLGYLKQRGKEVWYAVKDAPAQNDLCLADVERLGLRRWFSNFISTGAGSVGIRKDEMSREIRELWESDALVISKGMGNYETISEFDGERRLIYVMKLKCPAVAESIQRNLGHYIAILGGDHGR